MYSWAIANGAFSYNVVLRMIEENGESRFTVMTAKDKRDFAVLNLKHEAVTTIDTVVRVCGNSGKIGMPKNLVGKRVKVYYQVIDEE